MSETKEEIQEREERERMQENLLLIRRATGWTADEFGKKIGVTRQTINNLERKNSKYKLSKTQYLAMRNVLDGEMKRSSKDTQMLKGILEISVDHPEKYTEEEKKKLMDQANMTAPSILASNTKTTREDVSLTWMDIMSSIIAIGGSVALGILFTSLSSPLVSTKPIKSIIKK